MFTGHSSYSYAFNNPVMFGDPSGLAPEPIQKGGGTGDVLLGQSSLANIMGDYSTATQAYYDVVSYKELMCVGFQRYEIEGRSVDNPDGYVDYEHTPLTLGKTRYSFAPIYREQTIEQKVKISGGTPGAPAGATPGGGSAGGGSNNNTYTNSWDDVIGSFDLSNVSTDLANKFTTDMKKMYDAWPDFFNELAALKSPIDVHIIPGHDIRKESVRLQNLKRDPGDKLAPPGPNEVEGGLAVSASDGSQTLYIASEYYGAKTNISQGALESLQYYPVDISTRAWMFSWMVVAHELGHIFDALRLGYGPFFNVPDGVRESWAIDSENMMRVKMGFGGVLKSKVDLWKWPKYIWYSIQGWFYNRGINHADY